MKKGIGIFILFIALFIINTIANNYNDTDKKELENLLINCNDLQYGNYKVQPYIETAVFLQNKNSSDAIALLKYFAGIYKYENQLHVLCKMLFQKKESKDFRRPLIGAASFFANTDYIDWEKEPIEIIDGVPFLITRGYSLAGKAETALMYIEYCEKNCDWNEFIYTTKTYSEIENALEKILKSSKWKNNLSALEIEFFRNQIIQISSLKPEPDVQQLLNKLNSWDKEELDRYERPNLYPGIKTSGETNAWIEEHKKLIQGQAANVIWDSQKKEYYITTE